MSNSAKWHKLDNSAKIYPMMISKKSQNLFRVSVELYDEVDPETLERALGDILERYPTFNVGLKQGIFWYYFEELRGKPKVSEESDIIINRISNIKNHGYAFRVSYFKKRINADFFHAVCDGYGGTEFVKTLLYRYFELKGISIDPEEKIILPESPCKVEEAEDSFLKYAEKKKLIELKNVSELRGDNAFRLSGYPFDYAGDGVITGEIPSGELLSLTREAGVTVTEYLGAAILYSIYKTKIAEVMPANSLQLFIPINLRKLFPSQSLLNFSMFSRVGVKIEQDMTFEDFLARTSQALKRDLEKTVLRNKISTTVKAERLIVMRMLPLPLKQLIFNVSQIFFGKSKKTMTFSNMGVVSLPQSMRPYVDRFVFTLGTTKNTPLALTLGTTFDKTVLNFARSIADTEIEKFFFRFLASKGIHITVSGNFWEEPIHAM